MAPLTPYTYIQCPCSDPSTIDHPADASSPTNAELDDDERTFDPRAPRANYSLYPLEHLLYCEDCHQIRCPRCVSEEIVTFYCPSCLFEVPSSNIKSEGNRCTRSCFQCPICIGHLTTVSLESSPDASLLAASNTGTAQPSGPFILCCSYCQWNSTEIGIKFDKANGIYSQLAKLRNGGLPRLTAKERKERRKDSVPGPESGLASAAPVMSARSTSPAENEALDIEAQFANLKTFYQGQLSDTGSSAAGLSGLGDLGFASPNSLSRIMSIYTGGNLHDKKSRAKTGAMREALDADEGFRVADLDESAAIEKLREDGYEGTNSAEQATNQPLNQASADLYGRNRFSSELRPIPYLLRTKRSKRCPICRHIITKPESKVSSNRFRIRLVANNYMPSIQIRPLTVAEGGTGPTETLTSLKPVPFLLTFVNPIFETVKVTLATPTATPGRFSSKVTVFCPQFEIDANTDVWDEALKDGDKDKRRRKGEEGEGGIGKIWERGRNWVSVVVEVVPASLRLDLLSVTNPDKDVDKGPLREDEDILEIPMFIRVEWETEGGGDEVGTAPNKEKDAKEKRELAYWCVLGLGRISQG
ncbi:hypothetical protein GQ53DRAFT_711329 [Thozetella sp. PMI_491]|nr:hypothetical protein GQ53DRAFT_711329 [Thozetella sp. PMI_491]